MPTRGRTIAWCCALLLLVRIIAVGVALDGHATTGRHAVLAGDVRRYRTIAAGNGTPYADFAVEYPPLTLGAIDALDRGTLRQSAERVMWSQVLLDGLIALLLAWGWGRRAALVYLLLGLAFAWYPFLYLRLDLLSVALAVGGLALIRRRHPVGGARPLRSRASPRSGHSLSCRCSLPAAPGARSARSSPLASRVRRRGSAGSGSTARSRCSPSAGPPGGTSRA